MSNAFATDVALTTVDGFQVAATRYAPAVAARGHIVVAGATGVPQGFYRRFAEWAAAQGFGVMTLDYRGIGKSRPARLRGFRMDYRDWARQDLAAAVDAMHDPGLPLYLVGHSYGGHAFGLLPNHAKVDAAYTFATGAGWHGWMPFTERLKVQFMWRILGPVLVGIKGYLPWTWLRMGEDLPLDVYRQWKRWCSFPHYFFDDPEMDGIAEQFSRVHTPIMACNALDDLWAGPQSRDAFMQAYRNAPWHKTDVDPAHSGLGPIGHMGYFRSKCEPLWAQAIAWMEQNRRQTNAGLSPG
jgi:predicted alpha/beta hydrolase